VREIARAVPADRRRHTRRQIQHHLAPFAVDRPPLAGPLEEAAGVPAESAAPGMLDDAGVA
jgi:hypothetical protein